MCRFALLSAALVLSLGAASAAPSHLRSSESDAAVVALSARAGVGGVARPGRWLPVDVTITGGQRETRGVLRVEWGDDVALRDLDVAAGAAQHFTVFLRAIAAAPTVHLAMSGPDAAELDVPVELAALEDPFTLCVGDVSDPRCTVHVAEEAVPVAWRGLDIADVVLWPAAATSTRHDAVRAFSTWRAMRWLGDQGPADPVQPTFDTRTPSVSILMTRLALLALATTLATAIAAWRRARLAIAAGVPAFAGIAAGALMLSPPALGSTAVQLNGVVHQFAGTSQSIMSAKAEIEHSRAAQLVVQTGFADATLTTTGAGATRTISLQDHDGRALYRATAGLGTRRRLTIDATIDEAWVGVTREGRRFIVSSHAPFVMSDCTWNGATAEAIGTLRPSGQAAIEPARAPEPGDTIVCSLPPDWLAWTADGSAVNVRGSSLLVFHFWTNATDPDAHAAR